MCSYIYGTNHKTIHFILRNADLLGVQVLAMCFRATCAFYIQQLSRVVDLFFFFKSPLGSFETGCNSGMTIAQHRIQLLVRSDISGSLAA